MVIARILQCYLVAEVHCAGRHAFLKYFDGLLTHDLPATGTCVNAHEGGVFVYTDGGDAVWHCRKQLLKDDLVNEVRHAVEMRKDHDVRHNTQ